MEQENSVNIGDGVTFICGSDRTVGTVIDILSPCRIVAQDDDVIQDGNGYAKTITRNENNPVRTLIKGRKGWKVLNQPQRVIVGVRDFYYDLSF